MFTRSRKLGRSVKAVRFQAPWIYIPKEIQEHGYRDDEGVQFSDQFCLFFRINYGQFISASMLVR